MAVGREKDVNFVKAWN